MAVTIVKTLTDSCGYVLNSLSSSCGCISKAGPHINLPNSIVSIIMTNIRGHTENRFKKAKKKSLCIVLIFSPNPFNRRAKLALARKIITAIASIALIERTRLSRRALCHGAQSDKNFSTIDVASEATLNQISSGRKGR